MIKFEDSPIVVPIDFSDACLAAIQPILEQSAEADLRLVHVMTPGLHMTYGDMGLMGVTSANDDSRREALRSHFTGYLADLGLSHLPSDIVMGDPGTEIAEYAQSIGAGLIAIASHGFHGFRRLMLGSVAERVLRMAHCSVLVLRRTDAE